MKIPVSIFRWLLLILILTGLGHYVATHLDQFKVIREIRLSTVVLIVLLHTTLLIANGFRYCVVARNHGLNIQFRDWIRIFITARLLNRYYPQSGSVYRAVTLKKEYDFTIGNYLSSFAAFSYLDRFFAVIFTLLIILIFDPSLEIARINVAMFLALAGILMIGFAFAASHPRLSGSETKGKFAGRLSKMLAGFANCIRNPRLLVIFGATSAFPFFISLLINSICFNELNSPIQPAKIAVLSLIKSALNMIPLTPGNMGMTEASYALVFAGMNGDPAIAIVVASMINLCALLSVTATCGIVQLLLGNKSSRNSTSPIRN